MKNNYFVVRPINTEPSYIFFNDRNEDDTQRAFDEARALSEHIAVFQIPRNAGPWDRVSVVGHRKRGQILNDIGRARDTEKLFWLNEELEALDRAYYEAGRDTVPAALVAA